MSLRDITIKTEYRSLLDNVARDFYIPLLSEAVSYKRAVGFFSSSVLIEISKGITKLVQNGGKIQLIVSPYLSEEDINVSINQSVGSVNSKGSEKWIKNQISQILNTKYKTNPK